MGKYLSITELKPIVEGLKRSGKTVVFGNGFFDLIHVGHVRYLKAAKELGDVLIVGINDDASVVTLGKRSSVITPLEERAEILCSICHVDYVVSFTEPTVERLLLELKPHVHAKGTDYTPETVPEGAIVRSYGGRVEIVGDPKDHSTRNIIEAVKRLGT
jgi:D-glycero-beta-D-manno-heptose 1-phosphate adenylyltransferase